MVYIDPTACPGLVSEISSYKWKEYRDGNPLDEPVKFKYVFFWILERHEIGSLFMPLPVLCLIDNRENKEPCKLS